jgi:hypothetical protein
MDFCLIFVPFGQYDEPEILPYAIISMCPKGADVRHERTPAVSSDPYRKLIARFPGYFPTIIPDLMKDEP